MEYKNKKCCQTLLGHESDIPCVIISNDNNALISCSNDKTIKIWEKA
jgi:WD40 repeat protein